MSFRSPGQPRKVLITGASGLFGANALLFGRDKYNLWGIYRQHPVQFEGVSFRKLDLTDEPEATAQIRALRPDVVIHSAAESNVDACEVARSSAYRANVEVPRFLARLSAELGARFVHFSTDAFFEKFDHRFTEEEEPTPVNYYGETKLLAEHAVLGENPRSLVVRTNFYGWNAQNKLSLSEWIISTLAKDEPASLFTDVFFSPILVNFLAEAIFELVERKKSGIFNVAGSEVLSKYEFGVLLCQAFGLDASLIRKTSVRNAQLKARRSQSMALSVAKLQGVLPHFDLSVQRGVSTFYSCLKNGYVRRLKGDAWASWDRLGLKITP